MCGFILYSLIAFQTIPMLGLQAKIRKANNVYAQEDQDNPAVRLRIQERDQLKQTARFYIEVATKIGGPSTKKTDFEFVKSDGNAEQDALLAQATIQQLPKFLEGFSEKLESVESIKARVTVYDFEGYKLLVFHPTQVGQHNTFVYSREPGLAIWRNGKVDVLASAQPGIFGS